MKTCPNCQNENLLQANFCNHCGTKLGVSDIAGIHDTKNLARPAERRQLTILFCDLVDSTPLSQLLDPEEYRQVITDYHNVAEKVIQKFNGHVATYLGDGLLVYFGYPEGLEDAPRAGVQAGLGIIKALSEANKEWEAGGRTGIKVRIGVHTGLVVVDDHLALGETVNAAARLEGLAPHNGVVISPQTMNLVQGWFEVKSTGFHTLKGISQPMEVFQVLSLSEAKTPLDVSKWKGLSPLVGRQQELQMLIDHWNGAKDKNGNLALVAGEAGIGKSRLIDSLEEKVAEEPDSQIFQARCSSYNQYSAFHPIIELLEKGILQFDKQDSAKSKLGKLEGFLMKSDMEFKPAMSLFAEFLAIPSEQHPPIMISPVAKRQHIMQRITDLFSHLASNHTLLFVLEDLHWADPSTLEWINIFREEIKTKTIFTICSTRPIFRPEWADMPEVSEIILHHLSREEIVTICNYQTDGKSLPDEVFKQIVSKTQGIPLFVEELTKMVIESDLLVKKPNGYELVGANTTLAIPSTLQDSLLARLDKLADVKEIVQVGSVLGREFSLEILKTLLPSREIILEKSLKKLLETGIFHRDGTVDNGVYQFKHALIQDAAYNSLLKSHRQQLHGQIAGVLEERFETIVQSQPELLAHHLTEAELPLQAIPIWLRAGQLASQKNASSESIVHLEKGIALLPHVENDSERNNLELDFRLTLGGAIVVAYGFPHPRVKETYNQARDVAKKLEVNPKLALVLFGLLSYYFNTEDYKAHAELMDYMFKLAKDPEHGYWFELFASQLGGTGKIVQGDFEDANRYFDRVLESYNPALPFSWDLAPSGHVKIGAKAWQMICLYILGHIDQAKNLSDRHLSYASAHNDSMTLYHIYTFPALYSLEAREWHVAEKIIEEYLPIVKAFGDPIFTLTAEVYCNIAKAFQGDRPAFDIAVHLINICFDVGFKAFAVSMSPFIGEQYFLLGEFESAIKWIDMILNHVEETGTHIHTAELIRIKGLTLMALGEPDTIIEKYFNRALELSRVQSAKTFELRVASDLAKLWKKQGKPNEGYQLLKDVYDWFTEGFDSVDLKEARAILNTLKSD